MSAVFNLREPVIVQTDKGEVKGRVWSRWKHKQQVWYKVLPDDALSLQAVEDIDYKADRVRAA